MNGTQGVLVRTTVSRGARALFTALLSLPNGGKAKTRQTRRVHHAEPDGYVFCPSSVSLC